MPLPFKAYTNTTVYGDKGKVNQDRVLQMINGLEDNLDNLSDGLKRRFKSLVVSQLSLLKYKDKNVNIKSLNVDGYESTSGVGNGRESTFYRRNGTDCIRPYHVLERGNVNNGNDNFVRERRDITIERNEEENVDEDKLSARFKEAVSGMKKNPHSAPTYDKNDINQLVNKPSTGPQLLTTNRDSMKGSLRGTPPRRLIRDGKREEGREQTKNGGNLNKRQDFPYKIVNTDEIENKMRRPDFTESYALGDRCRRNMRNYNPTVEEYNLDVPRLSISQKRKYIQPNRERIVNDIYETDENHSPDAMHLKQEILDDILSSGLSVEEYLRLIVNQLSEDDLVDSVQVDTNSLDSVKVIQEKLRNTLEHNQPIEAYTKLIKNDNGNYMEERNDRNKFQETERIASTTKRSKISTDCEGENNNTLSKVNKYKPSQNQGSRKDKRLNLELNDNFEEVKTVSPYHGFNHETKCLENFNSPTHRLRRDTKQNDNKTADGKGYSPRRQETPLVMVKTNNDILKPQNVLQPHKGGQSIQNTCKLVKLNNHNESINDKQAIIVPDESPSTLIDPDTMCESHNIDMHVHVYPKIQHHENVKTHTSDGVNDRLCVEKTVYEDNTDKGQLSKDISPTQSSESYKDNSSRSSKFPTQFHIKSFSPEPSSHKTRRDSTRNTITYPEVDGSVRTDRHKGTTVPTRDINRPNQQKSASNTKKPSNENKGVHLLIPEMECMDSRKPVAISGDSDKENVKQRCGLNEIVGNGGVMPKSPLKPTFSPSDTLTAKHQQTISPQQILQDNLLSKSAGFFVDILEDDSAYHTFDATRSGQTPTGRDQYKNFPTDTYYQPIVSSKEQGAVADDILLEDSSNIDGILNNQSDLNHVNDRKSSQKQTLSKLKNNGDIAIIKSGQVNDEIINHISKVSSPGNMKMLTSLGVNDGFNSEKTAHKDKTDIKQIPNDILISPHQNVESFKDRFIAEKAPNLSRRPLFGPEEINNRDIKKQLFHGSDQISPDQLSSRSFKSPKQSNSKSSTPEVTRQGSTRIFAQDTMNNQGVDDSLRANCEIDRPKLSNPTFNTKKLTYKAEDKQLLSSDLACIDTGDSDVMTIEHDKENVKQCDELNEKVGDRETMSREQVTSPTETLTERQQQRLSSKRILQDKLLPEKTSFIVDRLEDNSAYCTFDTTPPGQSQLDPDQYSIFPTDTFYQSKVSRYEPDVDAGEVLPGGINDQHRTIYKPTNLKSVPYRISTPKQMFSKSKNDGDTELYKRSQVNKEFDFVVSPTVQNRSLADEKPIYPNISKDETDALSTMQHREDDLPITSETFEDIAGTTGPSLQSINATLTNEAMLNLSDLNQVQLDEDKLLFASSKQRSQNRKDLYINKPDSTVENFRNEINTTFQDTGIRRNIKNDFLEGRIEELRTPNGNETHYNNVMKHARLVSLKEQKRGKDGRSDREKVISGRDELDDALGLSTHEYEPKCQPDRTISNSYKDKSPIEVFLSPRIRKIHSILFDGFGTYRFRVFDNNEISNESLMHDHRIDISETILNKVAESFRNSNKWLETSIRSNRGDIDGQMDGRQKRNNGKGGKHHQKSLERSRYIELGPNKRHECKAIFQLSRVNEMLFLMENLMAEDLREDERFELWNEVKTQLILMKEEITDAMGKHSSYRTHLNLKLIEAENELKSLAHLDINNSLEDTVARFKLAAIELGTTDREHGLMIEHRDMLSHLQNISNLMQLFSRGYQKTDAEPSSERGRPYFEHVGQPIDVTNSGTETASWPFRSLRKRGQVSQTECTSTNNTPSSKMDTNRPSTSKIGTGENKRHEDKQQKQNRNYIGAYGPRSRKVDLEASRNQTTVVDKTESELVPTHLPDKKYNVRSWPRPTSGVPPEPVPENEEEDITDIRIRFTNRVSNTEKQEYGSFSKFVSKSPCQYLRDCLLNIRKSLWTFRCSERHIMIAFIFGFIVGAIFIFFWPILSGFFEKIWLAFTSFITCNCKFMHAASPIV